MPPVEKMGGNQNWNWQVFSVDHVEVVLRKSKDDELCMEDALIKAAINNDDLIVNPIYNWSDSEIWQYINECGIETNPLYYPPYNYKRVGCVLCPMAGYAEKKKQEADFPGYKRMYIRAFDKMLEVRKASGLKNRAGWENGEEVYNWWIQEYKHNVKGQITIDEWLKSMGDKGNERSAYSK